MMNSDNKQLIYRQDENVINSQKKSLSASEVVEKWWNAKNEFFSKLTEEEVSNREVMLVHFILMSLLVGAGAVENSLFVSILAVLVAGGCVARLNKANGNDNINIKKNIL